MKHFYIDSENVGDFWIPLLGLSPEDTELIVFYTKNSPHMSYESLIRLKESDRQVTFIKCYEGTNALDFQLCSELGFQLCAKPGDEFIIVTNDTGYDAAVKYWRHKKYSVKRITGKESKMADKLPVRREHRRELLPAEEKKAAFEAAAAPAQETAEIAPEELYAAAEAVQEQPEEIAGEEFIEAEMPEDVPKQAADEEPEDVEVREQEMTEFPETEENEENTEDDLFAAPEEPGDAPDEEELVVIVNCIGLDNLAELHNQLIQFYGDDGKPVYQAIKNGSLSVPLHDWDKEEKFLYYCALIVRHSDLEEEYRTEESISTLAGFLCGAESKRRNLNSLRYALLKRFGKEMGRRYYFLLKPYVKAMNQM